VGGEIVFFPDTAKDFKGEEDEGDKVDEQETGFIFACMCVCVYMREREREREREGKKGREWECGSLFMGCASGCESGWVDVWCEYFFNVPLI
jgi:hypothetical protein